MNKLLFIFIISCNIIYSSSNNFELEVSRRLVNNFTDGLLKKNFQEIDTLVFDVSESQIQIKLVGHKKRFEKLLPALKRFVPLHKPGDVFQRAEFDAASEEDAEDFLIGLQLNLSLKMAKNKVDAAVLGFKLPKLAMYYKQDFQHYLSLMAKRNKHQIYYDSEANVLKSIKSEISSLGEKISKRLLELRLKQTKILKSLKLQRELIHQINLQLIRFTSASEIKLQASDHLVEVLFEKVSELGILSKFLDVRLLSIKEGVGSILVSNLSKALSPYAPGLKMTEIKIIPGDKEDGENVGNHRVLLKGKFFE
ncbi:MAG: hypothetical protein KC646_17905 [Candidatus Cloacimonetes bacterium]|nr:hypothetical protein [Candidatus Cloacimonadota bacterium]